MDIFLSHLTYTDMGKQSMEFADTPLYNGNCCPLFPFPLCCTTHIVCLAVPLVYELLLAIQVLMVYSYSKTNQMHQFQIIYFCTTLYMFQTVFLSIIRSSELHIQQQAHVKQIWLAGVR
jgi:hypothetical protein